MLLRLLGGVLLLGAIVLGAQHGQAPLGAVLFQLHPPLLNTLQAGVQRRLAPWLWDDVMLPIILQPAWLLPLVLGAILLLLGLRRRG